MITTDTQKLEKWAKTQIDALNPTPDFLLLRGDVAQQGALEMLAHVAREETGVKEIKTWMLDLKEMERLVRLGDVEAMRSYHESLRGDYEHIVSHGGSTLRLAGTSDAELPEKLSLECPENLALWNGISTEAIKPYRDGISSTGKHPWMVGYAPAEGDARLMFPALALDQAIEKAWEITFDVNLCNEDDPIAAWRAWDEKLHTRCDRLNALMPSIEYFEVIGNGTSARVGVADDAIFLGGSKETASGRRVNNNRPSFEVWTAPHKDRIDGIFTATMTFLCDGVPVENLIVEYSAGELIHFDASKGKDVFKKHSEFPGASKLGEFALVDLGSPIHGKPYTMQTLIEENRAAHAAFGDAYKNNIRNFDRLTDNEFERMGVNSSKKHTDFMWGGPETCVTAVLKDGSRISIMDTGKFVGVYA